ncbi:c-type cytochrome [Sphingomonas sp. HT-1]|uniref:c-type cytochrome n=1 Tax=unclassified Sphingomonas TaxID=196159 RepID=UPI0003192A67|nr:MULTISPECIES: c-type cytochrome [unclassified Sphingomonas]KTF68336.1 cytochrome C [Sphingomonas sp. WG]
MTIQVTWKRVVLTLVGIVALALAVGWSGAVNVAASSGHWPITNWFLHWVMRNSVGTRSALDSPKAAADPQGLVSAAGHFAASCAACHGAPGMRPRAVFQAATPAAPDLARTAPEWSDRELYWIIDHGVKFSGMPAWPARDRPDEIRRMVAFVRRLPTMSPADYVRLTGGIAGIAGAPRFEACAGCHGADGRGRGQPDIPVLGGQTPGYLAAALRAYRDGHRGSGVMANAAALLSDADVTALATRFAAMPGLGGAPARADADAARIVARGLPDRELPACASCHAPGKPYPVLSGQKPAYIAARLRQMRGDDKQVDARQSQATMPVIARRIPEAMIDRLAGYLGSSRPPREADPAK